MADYIWELGIDWDAIPSLGSSYLRQGLVRAETKALAPLLVQEGDHITFKIFDVSLVQPAVPAMNKIKSFSILIKLADFFSTQSQGDPFDALQLTFGPTTGSEESFVFPTDSRKYFPVWKPLSPLPDGEHTLSVQTPGRFLVSFLLQAGPVPGNTKIFATDPEMIVGANPT